MDNVNEYKLIIGGLLHVNEDAKLLEKVELLIDNEWIPLITNVSATTTPNIKVIVDGEEPSQMLKLSFATFEELQQIKAVRISGIVVTEDRHHILHIARNTISTEFRKGTVKEYGLIINVQFFTMLLEHETREEMMVRTLDDFKNYQTTLFLDYSDKDHAELDEYSGTKHEHKTILPNGWAEDILHKQFPESKEIKEKLGISRWNYTERQKEMIVEPVDVAHDETRKIQII